MTDFKVGDRVQYIGEPDAEVEYLMGHVGVVDSINNGFYGVRWVEPLPLFPYSTAAKAAWQPVTWVQQFSTRGKSLVAAKYDKSTVDALVAHLRTKGMFEIPNAVEEAFEEMTAPKTHTVVVEFEVDQTFDLVAVLTDLEDEHEAIRFVDVKED